MNADELRIQITTLARDVETTQPHAAIVLFVLAASLANNTTPAFAKVAKNIAINMVSAQ
jgi:hypothetical protein